MKRKHIALLLCAALLAGVFSVGASAAEADKSPYAYGQWLEDGLHNWDKPVAIGYTILYYLLPGARLANGITLIAKHGWEPGIRLWINLLLRRRGYPLLPAGQALDLEKFELTWQDEFDGGSLDRTKWNARNGVDHAAARQGGWWTPEVVRVEGGMLHIPSLYAETGIAGGPPGYYAAGLATDSTFCQKYGYFEARCKLPRGQGLWSAFWIQCDSMGNVDGSGRDGMEIDVYESPYFQQASLLKKNAVSSALHYDGYGEAHRVEDVGYTQVKKPYDTFHNYGLEWNENEYIFYIDGRESGRSSFGGVSHNEQWLLLSVEHELGGWAGDISLNKPGEMTDFVIDYVRVYQYA